ncbi:triple tyrosine motif-containing protein [Parapedobacter sp. 10938]|uniref:triple tyrosine motif-containing protein n=1 Tax=Parapedobacter flavus TaxID=3110225 RepID=UPI002DBA7E5A|nr:triple tyrosine motif-containing protein [Parapedobacter sp. 10938]MEC3878035.1 triple tyrosine motif-containing protein [Parapedobacter sp. 10938]
MVRPIIAAIFTLACIAMATISDAQEIQRIGSPLVQQYTKSDYKAGNQNWAVAVGNNGIMYVANADGLLVFDGQYWTLHPLPNKSTVRSVAVDEGGRIYTGGLGEFGYWEDEGYEQMRYQSISQLLDKEQRVADEVWKIIVDGDRVLFQTFSTIYIYEDNSLHPVRGGGQPFLFLHQVRDRIFVELIPSGLHELTGDKLVPIKDKEVLKDANVLTMLPFGADDILIGTAKSGLYRMDSTSTIHKWDNAADDMLKAAQLNNGLKVLDQYYAFGTILQGVVIIDEAGHIVQHLHKGNGLQNNTVLGMHLDHQRNIWVGLDNGIDRIEINAPLYYYADNTGSIGTVYAARIFEGNIYLGTNQGLFYSPWADGEGYHPFSFSLVTGSQGQVWDLTVADGELLCGHNDGTFKVSGDRLVKLSPITGGWMLKRAAGRPNTLLQGTYTGLAVFERTAHGWQFSNRVSGYNDPTQFIVPVSNTGIWASGYKGLRYLDLDAALTKVNDVHAYDTTSGLPPSTFVNVMALSGSPIFATDSGFFRHDEITDKFYPYHQLNGQLGSFAFSNRVIHADGDRYWFINRARIALVYFGPKGGIRVDSTRFATLNGRMMKFYESINRVRDDLYLIGLDDGFAIYQAADTATTPKKGLPSPLIRAMSNITDSLSDRGYTVGTHPEIPYRHNNIRISYALPWYSAVPMKYQFYLEGYSRTWSEWSEAAQKEFTNLKQGDYRFKVRARTADGTVSDIADLRFSINSPWWLSWPAWVVYALVLITVLIAGRGWYRRKIRKHRELIQANMAQKQRDLLAKEAEESEQRLVKLKNEQLERELASKSRELANTTMSIVYKNELLNNVHDELLQLHDSEGRKLSNEQLRKINKIIEDARSDERDWHVFEKSFNEAHENFFKKLKANYPELVPNDMKLCAYLRMNMSSKEIASLLNITTRGVEIRRYRLRKKLSLTQDKNLTEFLMEV